MFLKFENPRRGRQARNFSENDAKILDLKSSSEQIILRKLSLGAPESGVVDGLEYGLNFPVFKSSVTSRKLTTFARAFHSKI